MLTVTVEGFDDLTEYEQAGVSNNGSGKEYANYLRVKHGEDLIVLESDAMEPEDCGFSRDLSWIPDLLKVVYDLGKKDGRIQS